MGLYETLPYKVLEQIGKIELRRYDDFMLASTKTSPTRYGDSGFNNVFQYIAGANDQNTKISMTTPVVTYEEDNALVTGFYVPSKYDKTNVPKPTGGRVFLEENETSLYLVIRFRGNWSPSNYEKHDRILRDFIAERGYQTTSSRLVFRYQPPMVPGVFRRNEIAYRVVQK